jgi:proteasome lid subunit RPN8/RPN11
MLVLTAALADLLRHYGRCALPREAVGLLYGRPDGRGATVMDCLVPLANVAEGPARFRIDEKEFLAALRGRGTEPEAFFHTHPVEPAIPSTHDILGAAGWPRTPHVILSFDDRAEFRAWRIIDGQALPEPIRIV